MSLATELLHAAKNGVRITFRYSEGADALMIDGRKYTDHDRKIEYSRALSIQKIEDADYKNVGEELLALDVKRVTIDILKAERTDAPVMTPLNLSFNCGTPSPVNFKDACQGKVEPQYKAALVPGREDDGIDFIASMQKRFGKGWPKNYRHKPGTVILVDQQDRPIFSDNGDGTVSGLDAKMIWR
jgi:hypothetical protein